MSLIYITGDPFATAMIWLVLITAVYALFHNMQLGLVLLVSLVSARVLSDSGIGYYHAHVMLFCGFLCIMGTVDNKLEMLKMELFEIHYAVAYLYGIRAIMDLFIIMQLVNGEVAWVSGIGLLLIQIALVLGACQDGYRKRVNSRITNIRHRFVDALHFNSGHDH